MMVTRRNAVSQIVGFMSLENGLVLAATGAKGMPLVVEISVAFSCWSLLSSSVSSSFASASALTASTSACSIGAGEIANDCV